MRLSRVFLAISLYILLSILKTFYINKKTQISIQHFFSSFFLVLIYSLWLCCWPFARLFHVVFVVGSSHNIVVSFFYHLKNVFFYVFTSIYIFARGICLFKWKTVGYPTEPVVCTIRITTKQHQPPINKWNIFEQYKICSLRRDIMYKPPA